jgi:hypothetical protein
MGASGYAMVAMGISLFLGIVAFIKADSVTGRAVIVTTAICLFLLPAVWRRQAVAYVAYVGWVLLGLGCYIYIKWLGEGPF